MILNSCAQKLIMTILTTETKEVTYAAALAVSDKHDLSGSNQAKRMMDHGNKIHVPYMNHTAPVGVV